MAVLLSAVASALEAGLHRGATAVPTPAATTRSLAVSAVVAVLTALVELKWPTKAVRAGVEVAGWDALGQLCEAPVWRVLGLPAPSRPLGFYTVALSDTPSDVLASARFGVQHTPHVKVKVDARVAHCVDMLTTIKGVVAPSAFAVCACV